MDISRRSLIRLAGTSTALSLTACGQSSATTDAVPTISTAMGVPTPLPAVATPDEALARLRDGNARYVAGTVIHPDSSRDWRMQLASGQKPFAVVLACADSRVPPELIFDQGLGDIFVVRVAGNIVDDAILGSIEYAVEHLGSTLVVVMGHEGCGAVKATLDHLYPSQPASEGKPSHIAALVRAIEPALTRNGIKEGELTKAVQANVMMVRDQIMASEPILSEAVTAATIKVVGAYYDLDSGEVTLV